MLGGLIGTEEFESGRHRTGADVEGPLTANEQLFSESQEGTEHFIIALQTKPTTSYRAQLYNFQNKLLLASVCQFI